MFAQFFLDPSHAGQLLHVRHDPLLVILSVGVAMAASVLSLQMVRTGSHATEGLQRNIYLLCSCATLGVGVWAMHFIGMLALELSIPVTYHASTTVLSMLPSVLASAVALHVLMRKDRHLALLLGAGTVLGLGIGAMHYWGMAAMHMDAALRYEPVRFVLSLVTAVALALAAVWTWSRLAVSYPASAWQSKWVPAGILGLCMSSMHYASMGAANFVAQTAAPGASNASQSHQLAFLVAAGAAVLFLMTGLCAAVLRYRSLWQLVQRSEARLQAMADTAVDAVITIDDKGHVLSFNPAAERIFGWPAQEIIGRNLKILMPSPLADEHDTYLQHFGETGQKKIIGTGREVLGLHRDGRHIPLRLSIGQAKTSDGNIFVGFAYDLSERKRTETQLRIAASVFDQAREGIAVIDADQCLWQANPAFMKMLGVSADKVAGREPFENLYPDTQPRLNIKEMWQGVTAQGHWQGEFRFYRPNGQSWQQRLSLSAVYNEHKRLSHFIAVVSDVGQHAGTGASSDSSHLYDPLTGLPNHVLMMERIAHSIPSAKRRGTVVGVICMEFDQFARIKQLHGIEAGDELLQKMAVRIRKHLREEDTLARGSEHELVAILTGMKDESGLHTVLNRLKGALNQQVELSTMVIQTSASLGWSISCDMDAPSADLLVQEARAMIKRVELFDPAY